MNLRRNQLLLVVGLLGFVWTTGPNGLAQTREEKVRGDREKVESEGFWIYNDWKRAQAEAVRNGKPIIVVLRCIPCEECVKLDDSLVDNDPILRPLLDQFTRVRLVSTNGLNLDLFQYDFDQSFAVFLLNADGTIYGRFGTRSHRTEWVGDVSLQGLARALEGALELHQDYPANKSLLAGKVGKPLEFSSPEQFPSLSEKFTSELATSGEIAKSCIHCHQIGDAQREFQRAKQGVLSEATLFPYPHPKVVGLNLDPNESARIKSVEPGSAAELAGLKPGDLIKTFDNQPLLSTADLQWVLHHTNPDGGSLECEVIRGGDSQTATIKLAAGWRKSGDLSWRVSSWGLRRMTTGGASFESLTDEERTQLGLEKAPMALRVKHVGQYGAHAVAKKAGIKAGDIVVKFGNRADLKSETELLAYGLSTYREGDMIPMSVNRDGSEMQFEFKSQP